MGTVSTDRLFSAPVTIENHGNNGTFGLLSRDPTQSIYVDYVANGGIETIEIAHPGDSTSFSLLGVDQVVIRTGRGAQYGETVGTYPTRALIDWTTGEISLDAAPYISGAALGLSGAAHFDLTVVAGGSGTSNIWAPAAGTRFVVASLFVSSDTGTRVAVVDGSDVAGARLLVAPAIPAGGSLARYFGGPGAGAYVSLATGNIAKLVYGAAGTYFVSLDGFVQTG